MSTLTLTSHAVMRMAQRGIVPNDSELIALIGAEVDGGYLVRNKDYQEAERVVKRLLERLRRVVGKRLVVKNNRIVTAYQPRKQYQRRLLRDARERDLCD
jgi:hypothetical protein